MPSTADFLHRLRQFVHAEADAQQQALERQWSRPVRERVARGWAIEGLRVAGFDKNIVRLVCDSNHSRFREGDLVVLHHGNPKDPNALHFDLYYDGETELEASLIKGNHYFMTIQPDGWILDQDWFDSSSFVFYGYYASFTKPSYCPSVGSWKCIFDEQRCSLSTWGFG